jgi:hypothetical protein
VIVRLLVTGLQGGLLEDDHHTVPTSLGLCKFELNSRHDFFELGDSDPSKCWTHSEGIHNDTSGVRLATVVGVVAD